VGNTWPTGFINEIYNDRFGVTCDHSLEGSQVFKGFEKSLLMNGVLPWVPGCSIPPKSGKVSPWLSTNLQKTASKGH
jgi:hypothetical protein